MLHAVIMAGGSGTRLWPESRKNFPKQLMTLTGGRSFLQATADRLQPAVKRGNIRIVTGKNLQSAIRKQLPELPDSAVIAEPCARNTSACIALAAVMCLEQDPDAVMAILPSDHIITPSDAFQQALLRAEEIVKKDPEKLITLGITPTYPAESFGYIERGAQYEDAEIPAFHVLRFREKPDRQTAEAYIETGNFAWNAGIFIWKAAEVLENLKRYAPGVSVPVEKIRNAAGTAAFSGVLESEFPKIENISIDYAVMEKAAQEGRVLVLPAPFSWDDVGSWRSLERLYPQDAAGNTLSQSADARSPVLVETRDCTVRNTDASKTVVCYGVKDLAVVVTPDVVLVFDRNCEESVRNVTKKLKEMNYEDLL